MGGHRLRIAGDPLRLRSLRSVGAERLSNDDQVDAVFGHQGCNGIEILPARATVQRLQRASQSAGWIADGDTCASLSYIKG
jgi:hypothetical protein